MPTPDGVVVDANVIADFNKQVFFGDGGYEGRLISVILERYGLAVSRLIEQEWKNTCGAHRAGHPFNYWYEDMILKHRIVLVEGKLERQIMRTIHNRYGLPRDSRDKELIKVANVTVTRYILSNDIHLHDPKAKRLPSKTQDRIKKDRTGRLCTYLREQLEITVGLCIHCEADLGLT